MGPLAGTMFVRLTGILLVGFVLFNLAMALALLAPFGRERAQLFLFPLPAQAAAIVHVLEATPAGERARLLDALNSRALSVTVVAALPADAVGRPGTEVIARMWRGYDEAFAGRDLHIELRRRTLLTRLADGGEDEGWEPGRAFIGLADGSYLLLEPARGALFDAFLARGLAIAGIVGLVVVVGLVFAVRRTAKPIAALAVNARSFAERLDAPELAETGPREVRELARALNHMQRRIRGLVGERTRLLAATTHDLRTYLTRMRLRTEFIADSDQRARAERDIDEMEALVDDTLLFARTSEGHADRDACADLAAEIGDLVAARAERGQPVTLAHPPPPDSLARIEPVALRRIFANLVENALRYGGCARLSVSADGEALVIDVDDEGPGIPESDLDRVMAPFERIEPSRARSSGGAGLGLAIAGALAAGHDGSLVLANRPEGGLRARLRLQRVAWRRGTRPPGR
ncbi:MAG: ATP-binding protein [Alphaproteobacteria bacterium]